MAIDEETWTDRFRQSADDGARSFRNVYFSYLVITLYIFVTVWSTTEEMLLRGSSVSMPIINVDVPIVSFFMVAPWLLLILHFNILILAIFFTRKVQDFKDHLCYSTQATQEQQLRLLFPVPLGHLIASGDSRIGFKTFLAIMVIFSLVAMPILWLIYTQVKFLIYQNEEITYMHRLVIIIDFILLWWMWPRIVAPHLTWAEWWKCNHLKNRKNNILLWARNSSVILSTLLGLFFIIGIATVPGEATDKLFSVEKIRDNLGNRFFHFPGRFFVREEPYPEIIAAYISKNIKEDFDSVTRGGIVWQKHSRLIDLSGRNFRTAQLSSSYFYDARLQETDFSGANLWNANLQRVTMYNSLLQIAFLKLTSFQQANLEGSIFHAAILIQSNLEGAQMKGSKFYGANLTDAKMIGANLINSELLGADLSGVNLQGAILTNADLRGANLTNTNLQGADLRNVRLGGAILENTDFSFADIRNIKYSYQEDSIWDEINTRIKESIKDSDIREIIFNRISERKKKTRQENKILNSVIFNNTICDAGVNSKCKYDLSNETEYYNQLISFLSMLACDKENEDIAAGIALRIHNRGLSNDSAITKIEKDSYISLARTMLSNHCPGANNLVDWLRNPLASEIAKEN